MTADIRHQIEYAGHLLAAHEPRCTIGAFAGVDEISLPVVLAIVTETHFHHQCDQQQQQAGADKNAEHAIRRGKY